MIRRELGTGCDYDTLGFHLLSGRKNEWNLVNILLDYFYRFECEGFTNVHPQLTDSLTGWVDQAAGVINLAWNSSSPVTFTQPETILDLVFTTKQAGQGQLVWYTGATESYFTDMEGSAIPAQFHNGQVNIYEPPVILTSASRTACEGQALSIAGIASGNHPPIAYRWIYPAGDTTGSDPFFASITRADAGDYTLLATDAMGCTDQQTIRLEVSQNPVAAFHGTDTLEVFSGDYLDAGTGLFSYFWNTGDTTESIVIQAEGMYIVVMESQIGCLGSDSVFVKLKEGEIPPEPNNKIFIPNAFSPDGDGVNDVFRVAADGSRIEDL